MNVRPLFVLAGVLLGAWNTAFPQELRQALVRLYPERILIEEFRPGKPVREILSTTIDSNFVGTGMTISEDGFFLTDSRVVRYSHEDKLADGGYRRTSLPSPVRWIAQQPFVENSGTVSALIMSSYADHEDGLTLMKLTSDTPVTGVPFAQITDPVTVEEGDTANLSYFQRAAKFDAMQKRVIYVGSNRNSEKSPDLLKIIKSVRSGQDRGGAVYHTSGLLGFCTGDEEVNALGVVADYLYPGTWALKPMLITRLKYGRSATDKLSRVIDSLGVNSSLSSIVGFRVNVAQSNKALEGAWAYVYTKDQTFDDVKALDEEVGNLRAAMEIYKLRGKGQTIEQIAHLYKTSEEDIRANINTLDQSQSPMVKRVISGEFVYQIAQTDDDGFCSFEVPRNQALYLSIEGNSLDLPLTIEIPATREGILNLGTIDFYER